MTPLAGRTVVVTRARGQGGPLAARLAALGANVLFAPAIAFEPPPSWAELDAALDRLGSYRWAAFASATAVEHVLARMKERGQPASALARPSLAAVGKGTAAALEAAGLAVALVPPRSTGAELAAALAPHVAGERVLAPRALEGRPELVEGLLDAGALVTAPPAYRTVAPPASDLAPLREALARGEAHAVAFASPSAVRNLVAALGDAAPLLHGLAVAVIGPTTADAAAEAGLPVSAVAREPTGEALAGAVAEALAAR